MIPISYYASGDNVLKKLTRDNNPGQPNTGVAISPPGCCTRKEEKIKTLKTNCSVPGVLNIANNFILLGNLLRQPVKIPVNQ
jgi:hypothetical protein